MLHALQHPCIVALVGISIHPLCFALELAPLSSLNTVLSENAKGTHTPSKNIPPEAASAMSLVATRNNELAGKPQEGQGPWTPTYLTQLNGTLSGLKVPY